LLLPTNSLHQQSTTILVPLCGKTRDLLFLKEQGLKVIGIEGNRIPIEEFKKESGLELREGTSNDYVISHETEDGSLRIYQADFLTLDFLPLTKTIDCVWDRAALNAITVDQRSAYIASVKKLLKQPFKYLLSAYEYDSSKGNGPPYSLPFMDIQQLFGDFATIIKLEEKEIEIDDRPMVKFVEEDIIVNEVIYLLQSPVNLEIQKK
jgi:thiopurine S-methyltransferase